MQVGDPAGVRAVVDALAAGDKRAHAPAVTLLCLLLARPREAPHAAALLQVRAPARRSAVSILSAVLAAALRGLCTRHPGAVPEPEGACSDSPPVHAHPIGRMSSKLRQHHAHGKPHAPPTSTHGALASTRVPEPGRRARAGGARRRGRRAGAAGRAGAGRGRQGPNRTGAGRARVAALPGAGAARAPAAAGGPPRMAWSGGHAPRMVGNLGDGTARGCCRRRPPCMAWRGQRFRDREPGVALRCLERMQPSTPSESMGPGLLCRLAAAC